jgi:hypothetical protein
VVNVEAAMVEDGKDERSGRPVMSVASHDSILPIDRVKLTRVVDISTNSTCLQLSAL